MALAHRLAAARWIQGCYPTPVPRAFAVPNAWYTPAVRCSRLQTPHPVSVAPYRRVADLPTAHATLPPVPPHVFPVGVFPVATHQRSHWNGRHTDRVWRSPSAWAAVGVVASAAAASDSDDNDNNDQHTADDDLPVYSSAEVAQHNSAEKGIWVSFDGNVYDITDFIKEHPGGPDKIVMAAGGGVEPFWSLYTIHMDSKAVKQHLSALKIGRLDAEDAAKLAAQADANDPYAGDPKRHPGLKVHKDKPFNAETPTALIADNFITPNDLWYVRHHHPVPHVDEKDYRLKVVGPDYCVEVDLEHLRALPKHKVVTTIQCAGNRRAALNDVAPTQGLKWDIGAISTAEFAGARLSDVMAMVSVKPDTVEQQNVRHIQFVAMDPPYDASIPVEKALDPRGDVLLAYEMNGSTLPAEHGYPIRAIVPGHVGARNVKWVGSVVASSEESESTWQRGVAYKGFSPNVTSFESVDPSQVASVQELPVQSAICEPAPGATTYLEDDEKNTVTVKGFAYSGGGRGIVRVDVSADQGKSWTTAQLKEGANQPAGRAWAWTLWEAQVPVTPAGTDASHTPVEMVCKAVDTSYNTQPERTEPIWNLRGILNNSWHHVAFKVSHD